MCVFTHLCVAVRLFGQGLEIIEVSDDGNGVPVGSRPYMATRHATSKIERLEDIYEGTGLTMGFRGEALFAMACVSDSLVVASRTEDDELATKLVFGKDGKPIPNDNTNDHKNDNDTNTGTPLARKVGTTVAVVKPFGNLPARRADLVRRIKQERTRIFKLVESYGIFNVGVCFRLLDISSNREDVALATSASSTKLQETASTLLGPAFLKGTTSFEVCLESFFREKHKKGGETKDDDGICYNWGIRGLISVEPSLAAAAAQQRPQRRGVSFGGISSAASASKPTAARARIVQYYSINGRVVELPKVTALLKRLWLAFSSSVGGLKQKKPSALLEFTLPNDAFDINLSPDKKTVLLTHEEKILGIIEERVTEMWSIESSNVFVDGSLSQLQEQPPSKGWHATRGGGDAPMDSSSLYEKEGEMESRDKYEYEYDEDEHHKHKRRFAFVHDISKAKMQHDMSERRASDENSVNSADEAARPLKQTKLTPIVQTRDIAPTRKSTGTLEEENQPDNQLENQSSPNKETKVLPECDAGTEKHSSPTHHKTEEEEEPQQLPSPEDRVSDLDRRKWTEIQSKFSRDNGGDIEQSIKHHRSRNESVRGTQNESTATPSKAPVTPEDSTVPPLLGPSTSSSRPRRGNLQQFAFQSDTQKSSNTGGRGNLEQYSHQSKSAKRSSGGTDDRYQRGTRTSMPPPEERPPALHHNTTSEENANEAEKITSSRKRKERDEIPIPVTDRDRRIQNDRISKDTDVSLNTDAKDTEPEPIGGKSSTQVVWGSFSSTEDICLSARLERLNMRKRKRDIDDIRRSIRNEQNGTNAAKKENTRRGNSENEVVKEVAFDDEGDGNEDDSGFIRMPKSTFRSGMQVIGQFNLGFILARCSRNHLWILDQHACDEKYNYEQLCKKTVIHQQPLIRPLPLELTPSEEACVLDHMDIFEANGFRFSFDDQAPIRHRLSLTALPHSGAQEGRKAVQFGPSDVSALCSILTEGSSYDAGSGGTGTDGTGMYGNNAVRRHAGTGTASSRSDRMLARLPKAIAMFASRACRTSIMIGTALSHKEMNSIVQKLAKVDMPWNCPHGRPTMRHVANVLPMVLKDERRAAEHIAVPTITVVPNQEEEPQEN